MPLTSRVHVYTAESWPLQLDNGRTSLDCCESLSLDSERCLLSS